MRRDHQPGSDVSGGVEARLQAEPAGPRREPAAAAVLALQRAAGNRSTNAMIQAKLEVGPAADRYEREADQVADVVVRQLRRSGSRSPETVESDEADRDEPGTQRVRRSVGRAGASGGAHSKIQRRRAPAAVEDADWNAVQLHPPMDFPVAQVKEMAQAAYTKSLGKGRALLENPPAGAPMGPQWVQALADKVRAFGYQTINWTEEEDQREDEQVVSTGRGQETPVAGPARDYDNQLAYYKTKYDPDAGRLVVDDVSRERDNVHNQRAKYPRLGKVFKNWLGPKKINTALFLNEMLLHQLVSSLPEERREDSVRGALRSVRHESVVNPATRSTVFLTDGGSDAMVHKRPQVVDDHGTDDFMALLGTPNLESALRLLLVSGDALGIGAISAISYNDDWIEVTYAPAVGQEDAELETEVEALDPPALTEFLVGL